MDRGKNNFRICSYRRQTVGGHFPTVWRPSLQGNTEVILPAIPWAMKGD
jgi:hypothetical protein